ncbi:Zinc finger C3HC4 type [Gracilaria domingensis]|nr:Zinc finger C3HC4 type [Gracilaria domingensis]
MGIAQSQEEEANPPNFPLPPPRPMLGPRPQNAQNVPFASFRPNSRFTRSVDYLRPVKMGHRVENVFIVPRDKIRLLPCSSNSSVYVVEFEFKADVPGNLSVCYDAREVLDQTKIGEDKVVRDIKYIPPGLLPAKSSFAKGNSHVYRQRAEEGLDMRQRNKADLKFAHDGVYPLVIRLDASQQFDDQLDSASKVKSHITLAEVIYADGQPQVRVIEQKVYIDKNVFSMEDMYGIQASYNATHGDHADSEADSAAECVVCLTEPSTTAVQPCKHLCLCDDCARILTLEVESLQKCPVCRSPIGKLLRILDPSRDDANPSTEGAGHSSVPGAGATTSSNSVMPAWHPMQYTSLQPMQTSFEASVRGRATSVSTNNRYTRNSVPMHERGSTSNFNEGSTHPTSRMHLE